MKKKILIGLALFFITGMSNAQEGGAFQVDQPFRIQVYTGGPSLTKVAVDVSNNFQDKLTYSGVPLIGMEFDYKIVDWFSIGLDASYRFGQVEFDVMDSTFFEEVNDRWDINLSNYIDPFGHYELKIPRFRGMLKANFHVLPAESRSDLYFTAGIGYNQSRPKLFIDNNEVEVVSRVGLVSLPVSYRTSVGYSYHFINNLGVFAEVGIGGPIFSGGITARF